MSRILTIDHGNTRAKACVFSGTMLEESVTIDELTVEALIPLLEKYNPEGAIYGSVAHIDPKFVESLRHIVEGELLTFTPRTPVPVKIEYGTPDTLGVDRIAAAVAAAELYPDECVLVVDAGSAVTYDLIDHSTFKGGNISPGITMRFAALHEFTGSLPLESPKEPATLPLFGHDTSSAIRCGVVKGYAAEVTGITLQSMRTESVTRVLLTGGDTDIITRLYDIHNIKYTTDRHLVARGLNRIYHHNETI